MKSFEAKDGADDPPGGGGRNEQTDFHGQKRPNETHIFTTDPDARLYRKGAGKEAKLSFMGHGLMENRSGLLVDACLTPADGHAERMAALVMIERHAERPNRITLGADKACDAADFVNELRCMGVTPHVAQNTNGRRSAIDGRTTRHRGYEASQRIRKRIEETFGWIKTIVDQDKTVFIIPGTQYLSLGHERGFKLSIVSPEFRRDLTAQRTSVSGTFAKEALRQLSSRKPALSVRAVPSE